MNALPPGGIPGVSIVGRLPRAQVHWAAASERLKFNQVRYHYSQLSGTRGRTRSALTPVKMDALAGSNAYQTRFAQGATIVPRNFFFVEMEDEDGDAAAARGRVVLLRTSVAADREAKAPWKGNIIEGRVEGGQLFRTAISKNVLPFVLVNPPLVVLPVTIDPENQKPRGFHMTDAAGLTGLGFRYASQWFSKAETLWEELRTDNNRSRKTTLSEYLNWQGKLTNQNPDARYLVLYTSSATDASAVVVDTEVFDHPFIIDHKTYWCDFKTLGEAHYVCAYINSGYANEKIKDFQSRGLFGARDIHKTIVKLPFPKYKRMDPEHAALSALGKECAALSSNIIGRSDAADLQARALGQLRSRIRDQLATELESIDVMVEVLSSGRSKAAVEADVKRRRRRRTSQTGNLFS